MKKLIFAFGILAGLTGCFGPPMQVSVIGKSGKAYTAPSLCAALVQCTNSSESACYYEHDLIHNADGTTQESGCKEVKK